MGSFALDLRLSVRSLLRSPAFAAATVVVLALGIGAVTVVFTIANGVLLQPLPYAASERLGIVWHDLGEGAQSLPALNALDYRDYRARSRLFEDFTVAAGRQRILGDPRGEPSLVQVGLVASHFFSFFGVSPVLGRHFTAEEDVAGGPRVVLVSHDFWQGYLGADPGAVGRKLDLDGEPHEVVGVLPPGFRLLLPPEAFRLRDAALWVPIQLDWAELPPRNFTGQTAFGRLRPGVTFAEAQHEMDQMAAELRREHPVHAAASLRARIVPLHFDVVKRARPGLALLGGATALVLLVACANVVSLALVRGHRRQRELRVRAALGAGRWGLARMALVESLLLSAAGTVLGVVIANAALRLVQVTAANSLPRLQAVAVDARVLAFAAAACAAVGLLSGLLPALAAARADVAAPLAEGAYSSESRRQGRLRSLLIAGEIALSLVLLVGLGLLARSFVALQQVRPGFEPEHVLSLRLSLPPQPYSDDARRLAFHDALRARILALPGVTHVGTIHQLPLTGSGILQPYAYDEETARNWESVTADHRFVTPGWFDSVGARIVRGRDFERADLEGDRRVLVIDETLAARAFAGREAVGQRLQVESNDHESPYAEVVGVVAHVHLHDLTRAVLPQIYEPRMWLQTSVTVRSAGDPDPMAPLVRREIRALEPSAAIEQVTPLATLVKAATSSARLNLVLMGVFGCLALVLTAVGLYGVVSYSVSRRTRELGVRLALGSSPRGIRRLVLGQGLRLVAASLAVGLAGAVALAGSLRALLVGIAPWDPVTYAAATALLGAVALFACWVPARRASRMSPVSALRAD
jgi:putative ABC transport system permease protein